jgi:hypothetical protein
MLAIVFVRLDLVDVDVIDVQLDIETIQHVIHVHVIKQDRLILIHVKKIVFARFDQYWDGVLNWFRQTSKVNYVIDVNKVQSIWISTIHLDVNRVSALDWVTNVKHIHGLKNRYIW